MAVGQCKYVLITNADGGIINDPVLLRLAENHFWISLADSDVLLWAQGVAVHAGLDVEIVEPDVSPLQLQGPKSGSVMEQLFGPGIHDLKYYWLREVELDGVPLVVSRTGWSSELGYELYLRDGSRGDKLWETIMAAGAPLGLKPGHTSSIRRIEGGMLSYHADADITTNPYELGLERLVNLDIEADFIGKEALRRIRDEGVTRQTGRPRHRRRAAGRPQHVVLAGSPRRCGGRQGHLGDPLTPARPEHRAGHGCGGPCRARRRGRGRHRHRNPAGDRRRTPVLRSEEIARHRGKRIGPVIAPPHGMVGNGPVDPAAGHGDRDQTEGAPPCWRTALGSPALWQHQLGTNRVPVVGLRAEADRHARSRQSVAPRKTVGTSRACRS